MDAEFDANIDAIVNLAERLLTTQNAPSVLVQFFEWFSKRSQKAINHDMDVSYPEWLNRLTRISTSMKMKKLIRDGDQMAKAANMIGDLTDNISYCATEMLHVKKSQEILNLLKACQRE